MDKIIILIKKNSYHKQSHETLFPKSLFLQNHFSFTDGKSPSKSLFTIETVISLIQITTSPSSKPRLPLHQSKSPPLVANVRISLPSESLLLHHIAAATFSSEIASSIESSVAYIRRAALPDAVLHTGGSINLGEHKKRMEEELKHTVSFRDVYARVHKKKDGEYVSQRSKLFVESYD
ncbi:uncharacterized protein LOC131619438 [Vicia villosa]|uniref:uncharacterized protein LOC131619438 n=1 Tax=Vicia villosa TaxID=3911 RepID=UPI00273B9399|nr:uncharacterized protein LOC131619438 [Vicia villosa]